MIASMLKTKKAPKVTKQTKEWVKIPVEGLHEVTIRATMKQRKQQKFTKMRKEVNGIPWKLGATKAFVHWQVDLKQYKKNVNTWKKELEKAVGIQKLKELLKK